MPHSIFPIIKNLRPPPPPHFFLLEQPLLICFGLNLILFNNLKNIQVAHVNLLSKLALK